MGAWEGRSGKADLLGIKMFTGIVMARQLTAADSDLLHFVDGLRWLDRARQ